MYLLRCAALTHWLLCRIGSTPGAGKHVATSELHVSASELGLSTAELDVSTDELQAAADTQGNSSGYPMQYAAAIQEAWLSCSLYIILPCIQVAGIHLKRV